MSAAAEWTDHFQAASRSRFAYRLGFAWQPVRVESDTFTGLRRGARQPCSLVIHLDLAFWKKPVEFADSFATYVQAGSKFEIPQGA